MPVSGLAPTAAVTVWVDVAVNVSGHPDNVPVFVFHCHRAYAGLCRASQTHARDRLTLRLSGESELRHQQTALLILFI